MTSRPRAKVSLLGRVEHAGVVEELAEADHLAGVVGDLDADHVLAGDGRLDADRPRGEGHGQVVGEALDARELDAGVRVDLVLRDDRADVGAGDRGRDLEAAQLLLDDPDVALVVELLALAGQDAGGSSSSVPGSTQSRTPTGAGVSSTARSSSTGARPGRAAAARRARPLGGDARARRARATAVAPPARPPRQLRPARPRRSG